MTDRIAVAMFMVSIAVGAFAATPAQQRVQAAAQLQRTFQSDLGGWGLHFVVRGKNCDVLHMDTTEVNLYPQMMEAMAYGTVEYGRILPGGVNKMAFNRGFRTVVYSNAHNARHVSFGDAKLDRKSASKLRVCTDAIAAKITSPERHPSRIDTPPFESLSWANVAIGVKLYDGAFKHEATIVGLDRREGVIRVKYVSSGDVEPKLLNAVARFWYVKSARGRQ